MDGDLKRGKDPCRQLLDLIPKDRTWMVKDGGEANFGVAEERKLELRLGPPGEDWPAVKENPVEPALSLGYFSGVSKSTTTNSNLCAGTKRGVLGASESKTEVLQQQTPGFPQAKAGLGKELSHKTNGRTEQQQSCLERKPCYPPPPPLPHASSAKNATVANNSSQPRIASTPVVGWPPVRSFRKNLATPSKPSLESQKSGLEAAPKVEHGRKGLFVKINMDGIPIGRKVDLKAYDSYEKLSLAVDELFRGLLAAQRDPPAAGTQRNVEEKQAIINLLDGSGEYTLVYEDDDGDRMLVGDVPWDMFVSTVKRLRVLKSSELSALSLGAVSRKRAATECRVAWKE